MGRRKAYKGTVQLRMPLPLLLKLEKLPGGIPHKAFEEYALRLLGVESGELQELVSLQEHLDDLNKRESQRRRDDREETYMRERIIKEMKALKEKIQRGKKE